MPSTFDLQAAVDQACGGAVIGTRQLSGDANETWAVDVAGGRRLVIRILYTLTPKRARQEVPVQQALTAAGIVTPISLVLASGDVVGEVSGRPFTASAFVEGEHPTVVTPALASDLGRTLALFHRATQQLAIEGTSWMNPSQMEAEVRKVRDAQFRRGLEAMQRSASEIFSSGLPEANLHGDVWPGNVFAYRDRITAVLDLETVEHAPRIVDIGRTAVALVVASTMSPARLLDLLAVAYDAVEPLSREEVDLLPFAFRHATIASAAWNIQNGHPTHAREMYRRANDVGSNQ